MRSLLLLAGCVAYVSAFCPPPFHWRRFVYAKGQAKVNVSGHEVTKGLRVDLISYDPPNPLNMTVLASANADDSGFYVIAGSVQVGCYIREQYVPYWYGTALRLYANKHATQPVEVGDAPTYDRIDVPEEFVLREDQPVKLFETNIEGQIITAA